jgi:hypothetical protein
VVCGDQWTQAVTGQDVLFELLQRCAAKGGWDTPHNPWTHYPLPTLQDLVASGQQPSIALLERCVMRAERSADVPALRLLMGRLDLLNYKIVGAAAKVALLPSSGVLCHCCPLLRGWLGQERWPGGQVWS